MTDATTARFLFITQLRDNLENLDRWGSCPEGHIQHGAWREGALGEKIPVPYCPTCERGTARCRAEEADRAAWVDSVRARLNEALVHLAHGLEANWDRLPCAKYPHCTEILGGGWVGGWPIPPGVEIRYRDDPWDAFLAAFKVERQEAPDGTDG